MAWYNDLRSFENDEEKQYYGLTFPKMTLTEKKRCIKKLLELRTGLESEIPAKKRDKNLIIGSWNIKEFGHTKQRLPESYFYITEIINRFDLIAIQEIKSSLVDLNIIMRLLGKDWAYIVNDITEGTSGNKERSAYVYNKKAVELAGIAGEITLWEEITEGFSIKQLMRTPYLTGFKAGWKKFSLINLHLQPDDDTEGLAIRKEEVTLFLKALKEKLRNDRFWNNNLIVAGDFNFYLDTRTRVKDGPTIQQFYDFGFKEIEALKGVKTNVSDTEIYDRLFFYTNEFFKIQVDGQNKEKGGVFDLFKYVLKDTEVSTYSRKMREVYDGSLTDTQYFHRYWKKNQLSDHLPIWSEIVIDSSDDYLKSLIE